VPDTHSMARVMPLLRSLRQKGVKIQMHASTAEGMGSMKSQFKKADASGARFAMIFGADEMAQGQVALKPLRGPRMDETAGQMLLSLDAIDDLAAHLLNG
jgi:histidyl-tRNA synthetase